MELRDFVWPDDFDGVIALWQSVKLHNPTVDSLEALKAVIDRNPGLFLVVIEDGEIKGSAMATFDGRRAYLYHVAVHPESRRKGYASALIEQIEQRLWALGANKIRFMVQKDNTAAQRFYESAGYGHDAHVVTMSKSRRQERAVGRPDEGQVT